MNFSELRPQIYNYLGFHGMGGCAQTDELIAECLNELNSLHRFRYRYEIFQTFPAFLQKEPYLSFLKGCSAVILSVMTLGAEVDRRIKLLSRSDMTRSVVADACASALLESLSDEYEKTLGKERTYRFCPGYGGSDVKDIRYIFDLLKPESIGVILLDSNYMLPSKSMAGVIGIGKRTEKRCGDCFLKPHCTYRKEGRRCFGGTDSEKKY